MVNIARLPGFLSLAALVTIFLNSSAEAAIDCGTTSKNTTTLPLTDKPEGEYIVVLKSDDGTHSEWLEECLGMKSQSILDENYSSKTSLKSMVTFFSVKGTSLLGYSGTFSTSLVAQISGRDDVKYVEKNGKMTKNYAVPSQNELFKRTTDNKPLFNLDRIDQDEYPVDGKFTFPDSAGKGVNIFVLDTGVDTTHEEFEGRAKFLKSFCDHGAVCKKGDGNGHGTHVSGTAAGKTVGVARKANILGVQVLDDTGEGSKTSIVKGLSFVLDQHKKGTNKNSIASMSLGGPFSQAINDAVKALTDGGVHVVVAAGNDYGTDSCKLSPSSEPSAINVGAIEDTKDAVADFSNIGKCLDIFAPGVNITSAEANTKNKFISFDGTSQATPHVSGTIALIIAKDGNLAPADMANKLIGLSSKGVIKSIPKDTPNQVVKVPTP